MQARKNSAEDKCVRKSSQNTAAECTQHIPETLLSARLWTVYDLFYIKSLLIGAGNMTGFPNTEKKTKTYTKCQGRGIYPKRKNKNRSYSEM